MMVKLWNRKSSLLYCTIILFVSYISFEILFSCKLYHSEKYEELYRGNVPSESIAHMTNSFLEMYDLTWDGSKMSLRESWDLAASWVTPRHIHPDYAPEIGVILSHLSTARITEADFGHRGTQLKLTLTLDGGQRVALKPKWYERDYTVTGRPYDGHDRHNGEIAAFHLNRLLGYHRAPLVVGRRVSMKHDITPVATQRLKDTYFYRNNNTCLIGRCSYCKTEEDGACADGDTMEAAVVLWLPNTWTKFNNHRSPWQRTYHDFKKAKWETNADWCYYVKRQEDFKSGPRLLDLMDAHVIDYLIGNADRHHYETFKGYNESMIVMLDNAKSFGNPAHDEASILTPLVQCCVLRYKTWERLQQLQHGVLSSVLRQILSKDPISPLLTELHYIALDRRLKHILSAVDQCVEDNRAQNVLIKDTYSMANDSPLELENISTLTEKYGH